MGLEIAAAALAISAVGTGIAAYSSYQQGQDSKRLSDYNAALMEQQASTSSRDASILANQTRQQNQRIQARQRASLAANGVVGDTGSPLIVEAAQAGYLEMGALETERQGNIRSGQYRQQAVLDRMSGSAAARAGSLNAAATLLQGGGRSVMQYQGIA